MGPPALDDLPEQALLLIDSAPIIYVLEGHPKFGTRFKRSSQAADDAFARRYRAILQSWQPIALDVDIAESAARLRVSLRLRLADAVQAASALAINAAALVTHDRDFSRVHSLKVIS